MSDLPETYVLSRKPKQYLTQGRSHCGVFTLKAILSAYDKDTKTDPRDYHEFLFGKIKGAVPPGAMRKLLQRNGLINESHSARKLTVSRKIELLKSMLHKNSPVILLVGNGYSKTGEFFSNKAKFTYHWISLWGYNDKNQEFYIYDSAVPTTQYDKNIPVGNTKRKYNVVIRDWSSCVVPWFWENYLIEINSSLRKDLL